MYNETQPVLPLNIPAPAYYQLIHTLAGILPPPLADTPEALFARNQAAVDKVAAMMPVNANEADLAAQCVAARAQAEDVMRLLRVHDGDTKIVMRLNAQYASLVRASLSALGHLQRTQAVRHKREANPAALKADEWTQYGATRTMQRALDAGLVPAAAVAAQSAPTLAAEHSAPAPDHSALTAAARPPVVPTPEPALAPPPPASVPVSAPPPPPAPTLPPLSAPTAERWPAPAAHLLPATPVPAPAPAPRRSRRLATPADADEPSRDLPAEADYYAVVYPNRAREMRRHGGLPPNCSFGPPDDALVHAIVTGTSPILRALDLPDSATA